MHKKLISSLLLGSILMTPIYAHSNPNLNDISEHWAKKEINQFISSGYVNGYEDKTFRPDNSITRAEFVKLVNKYFGFNNSEDIKFSDISINDWYYKDICIASKVGYINGYEDKTFKPDKTITREEVSKILISVKNKQDNVYDKLNKYPDKNKVSNWAKPYVEGAIEQGYLKGNDLGLLNPTNNITRAESITILSRVVKSKPEIKKETKKELKKETKKEIKNKPPVITAKDLTIKQGDEFEYSMINAQAKDAEGENISRYINYSGNVDTSKEGEYPITLTAEDDKGTTNSLNVKVIVESINKCYVSSNGSDSNLGSKKSPFKTFNKAIKSGAKTIIADPGEYWGQQIIANNLEKLHILINPESSSPTNNSIYLKNGDGLVFKLDNSTKLYKFNRTFNKNSRFHRVFITKELPPIEVGERSNGVNACIWETSKDYKKDKTLIPVLTLDECKSKQGTFFYDGESIYLNPTDGTIDNKVYRTPLEEGSLLNLVNINDLVLENIKAEFSYETVAVLYNNNNMTVRNCEFSYSALGEGAQPKKSNGNFYKCIAKKNRNDGFNIQTFGDTHFFDCEAMYNYDDGISHHTGCTGSIHGGEFYGNGKGGISPANGAKIDLFNTICHNNRYGIYSVSTNNDYLGTKVRHINNVCYDNEVGLQVVNYHVLSYNCKYTNNNITKQVRDNNNTSLEEL